MRRPTRSPLLPAILFAACGGCASAPPTVPEAPTVTVPPPVAAIDPATAGPIPVTAADPTLGRADALVTVVIFGDLADPFFQGAVERVRSLQASLGPGRVRLAVKHLAPYARDAARAAAAVQEVGGSGAFWRFFAALTAEPGGSSEGWAAAAGVPAEALHRALPAGARKVEEDTALAAALGFDGGPRVLVNGAECGPRTRCTWMDGAGKSPLLALIEAETERARAALAAGTRAPLLYAVRCADNLAHPAPVPPAAEVSDTFRVRHLLVQYQGSARAAATVTRTKEEALERAREAWRKARAGARFEELVAEYSDEPGAARRGGDLGTFRRGQMVPDFQTAVEATRVGDVSDVVETQFGYHVIQRLQ